MRDGVQPALYRAELACTGEDPWWTYAYSTMFDSVRQQCWSSVSGEVEQLTGRRPASVRQVLGEHPSP
ncbi:MAG: hypothetical protein JOZ41_14475 [Chloroflexi bacterium]|nr:hypothetical protein [Chloroflexota bacterium]